ncbi:MAG TPA: hypothetical protein VHQ87_11850 [Rhizobacter sp.]|nr:hypothetical protein [Rhizobacter sp.]
MFHARAFGSDPAHVEIAFDAGERARTVTAVLSACVVDEQGHALAEDAAWDWTLNQRLQALIAVRLASGDPTVELHAPCTQCGEAMALGLDLNALAGAPAAARFAWRDARGAELTLRLPRGRDLQRWEHDGVQSHEALAASLIEAVNGQPMQAGALPDAAWLPALDDAFEAHDPLTALRLQTACPACGHDNAVACDLEAVLLAGLARAQSALLDEVLRLASALHWSEQQIVALPRWRRAHYLRRLDAGGWA